MCPPVMSENGLTNLKKKKRIKFPFLLSHSTSHTYVLQKTNQKIRETTTKTDLFSITYEQV